jgi:hypothetical protein
MTSVLYPLGLTHWSVNFYAKPKGQIQVPNGVTSDGYWTFSNDPPPALDMSTIYNDNTKWVYP